MTHATNKPPSAGPANARVVSGGGFGWIDENRTRGFATWVDEIAHVEAQGYKLVSPEYYIPHWSEADATTPKIYVNGSDGVREFTTAAGRPASDFGYPLFFLPNK